jgi:vacuolar-type H+-ATPase subunit H
VRLRLPLRRIPLIPKDGSGGALTTSPRISLPLRDVSEAKMSEKKFLSWVGFKDQEETTSDTQHSSAATLSGSQSNVARIRELENQLAELRSRRDITSLTKEEFEILASETAMSLIKTAQSRESKANLTAQKVINDANRATRELVEQAQGKAETILSQAESRGRKYIKAAEADAEEKIAEASQEAEQMVSSKKREATAILTSAKREADSMVAGAVNDISNYRSWLTTAIAEASRLHKIQSQSLSAAEQAIEQTRHRLATAFEKLSSLAGDIEVNLGSDNRPKAKSYIRAKDTTSEDFDIPAVPSRKKSTKKTAAKKTAAKKKPAAKRK